MFIWMQKSIDFHLPHYEIPQLSLFYSKYYARPCMLLLAANSMAAVRSGVRDNIDLATLIDRSKTYWPDHIMGTNLRTYCCLLARPHFKLEDTWVTLTTQ